ncbi:recombinase family protein [Sulfobacillus thermosulfidooxidans]|uniref:recombinase family protein n=1 Tax=Sulfobacillus thermosulfidooxidans TaxID=28034 RepID=UPI0006B4630E|nr:recombinase family protein [Sulfobacillus thermosulfidooxidans]
MIAIYARVSTEEQAQHGASLAAQVAACRHHLGSVTEPVQEFVDGGESGADLDRPQLMALRAAVAAGQVSRIVILDPDRLSRKLVHQLVLTEEFERAGVTLEFVNFAWQDTPEGRLFYSLRGAIAEFEREKIRERARRGWIAKAEQGHLVAGMQRYGYQYDKETKTLTPDPVTAPVVQEIYRLAVEEHRSTGQIAQILADRHIPPPRGRVWWRDTVSKILRNPAYMGVAYVHRYDAPHSRQDTGSDEWIALDVPPLVDQATWLEARAVRQRYQKFWKGRQTFPMLLRRLAVCGLCGHALSTNMRTYRHSTYPYYFCPHRYPRKFGEAVEPACTLPWVSGRDLDEAVWSAVAQILGDPTQWPSHLTSARPDPAIPSPDQIARERRRIARARRQILHFVRQGLIEAADAEQELHALKQEEAHWTGLADAPAPPDPTETWAAMAARLRDTWGTDWQAVPFDVRRDVVVELLDHVTVTPSPDAGWTVAITFRAGGTTVSAPGDSQKGSHGSPIGDT